MIELQPQLPRAIKMYLRPHPEGDSEYREIEHIMQGTLEIIRGRANQPARGSGHDTEGPDTEI
eukprot:10091435-Lingulodinium_polyedra.AAC.1